MADDDQPTASDVYRVIRRLRMAGDYVVGRDDQDGSVRVIPVNGPVEEAKTTMLKRALAGQGITIGPDEEGGVIPVTGFLPSRPVGVGNIGREDLPEGLIGDAPVERG